MELMCPDHLKWGYFKNKISNSKNNISEETINILKEYNIDLDKTLKLFKEFNCNSDHDILYNFEMNYYEDINDNKLKKKYRNRQIENFNEMITTMPINLLIDIAKRICFTDYKVYPFLNIFNNSNYFDEDEIKILIKDKRKDLEKVIQKTYRTGAFNHRSQINDLIYGFLHDLERLNEDELKDLINIEYENFVEDVKFKLNKLKEKFQNQLIDENVEIISFNVSLGCTDIVAFDHNDKKYYSYVHEDEEILIRDEEI